MLRAYVRLTKREIDVLINVVKGLTTAEIARKLFVSTNTIQTHRKNIIKKLNAKNIVNAVVKAMRLGLIE